MRRGKVMRRVVAILHGVWEFCSFVFVPQWGRSERGDTEGRNYGFKELWRYLQMS